MLDLDFIRSHPDIIHQFNEVEQCVISKADHEDSVRWHEQLIRNTEELVQALELPNRVVSVCTGEMGDGKVGMYELECWIPSEGFQDFVGECKEYWNGTMQGKSWRREPA